MSLISINHHPSRRQLHQFGLLWLVFFGVLGSLSYFKSSKHPMGITLWSLAVIIPILGWIFPALMRIVFLGLSYTAFPIGFVVSHVILALVYYLVLTPVALLMRLFGYDPMQRQLDPDAETYWSPREEPPEAKMYFRQF